MAINTGMNVIVPIEWLPLFTDVAPAGTQRPAAVPVTDEALMTSYRGGDDQAFAQLYARHRGSLLRFTRHLCHHAAEAEEIFQETWIAVVNSRSRYRVESSFVTWLFSIAHRRAADARRQRARRPADTGFDGFDQVSAGSAATDPPWRAFDDARERALRDAIASLPFEQREVFLLRVEAGLGLRDIATLTHAKPEATKSRLRYALRALREAMKGWA